MKQYTIELWTKIINGANSWDMYAVMMPNGQPCAFGSKINMEAYAGRLNASNGVLA